MSPLRIASVPDDHPYLDAIRPDGVERVRFAGSGGPWAPSPLLERAGLAAALRDVDVLHVHFGYESLTPAELNAWLAGVATTPTALVVTVHDLRNPHHDDRATHDAQLTALLGAADAVATLSAGAAAEVERRWERLAVVVAHPSLLPAGRGDAGSVPPRIRADGPPRAGVHLKSLRRNIVEPARVVLAAAAGARRVGAVLRVDLHPEVAGDAALAGIRAAAGRGELDVRVHDRFSDAELTAYLDGLDVSVLPYRFGTHSGWIELCRDLGTAAVVPDCGYYTEQWPAAHAYRNNERTGLDERSLADAVEAALRAGPPGPADRVARTAQRDEVRAAHGRLYAAAVAAKARRPAFGGESRGGRPLPAKPVAAP